MLKLPIIFSSFIIFICINSVRCDYYTSVIGLEKLLGLESMWVENFEKYVKGLEETNNLIKMYVFIFSPFCSLFCEIFSYLFPKRYLDDLESATKTFSEETNPFYEDPLGSFQAIKRVISDWKELEDFVLETEKSDGLNECQIFIFFISLMHSIF